MTGKLYLVSVSNLKKLPTNIYVKLLITRKRLDIGGVMYAPTLAPSGELYKILNVGIDVALICFCNRKECHRYLVADYLAKYGVEVIEIT